MTKAYSIKDPAKAGWNGFNVTDFRISETAKKGKADDVLYLQGELSKLKTKLKDTQRWMEESQGLMRKTIREQKREIAKLKKKLK